MTGAHPSCALCGRRGALSERFGLEICSTCGEGRFDEGLDPRWGASLVIERGEEVDPKHYESALVCVLDIDVHLARSTPCSMRLVPERGAHKIVKLFKSEFQAGDKAFDDAVYIADRHREATEQFLSIEGVRLAILALLREEEFAKLEIGADRVTYRARHRGAFDPAELGLVTAAVALGRHLDNLTA